MKVRHKATGKIYDVIDKFHLTRPPISDNSEYRPFILARTNLDYLEQHNPEKYNRIKDNCIQRTLFYVEEPLSDFEILGEKDES